LHIGERIQRLRKDAGLSQEQLGEMLGVSRQAVSKWETGESLPELDKIILMAEVFGVTTDEILRETAPKGQAVFGDEEQRDTNHEKWHPHSDADGFETGPFAPFFRLAKRKGYLAGYAYMGIGALMGVMVLFFWFATNSMFGDFPQYGGDVFTGLPFGGGGSFTSPLKIFVILGLIVAVCVFALGAFIAVKMKKYKK
jgi:transcriptional regulator with XRE-family HTH domain